MTAALAVQSLTTCMPVAYAAQADTEEKPQTYNTDRVERATPETAQYKLTSEDMEESNDIETEAETTATTYFFAAIDDEWVKIGESTQARGPISWNGRNRYYFTAEDLETFYAPFEFDAETFDGGREFTHTDNNGADVIWADAPPQGTGADAKIQVSWRDKSYVYYLPNNKEGSASYFEDSKSVGNAEMMADNMFYFVSFEDTDDMVNSAIPDTMYVQKGATFTVSLPVNENVVWSCTNAKTGEEIENTQDTETDTVTISIENVQCPVNIRTQSTTTTFTYYPSVKESMVQLASRPASSQTVLEDATIDGKTKKVVAYREGDFVFKAPDSDRVMVSLPMDASSGVMMYYWFVGWKIGTDDRIYQAGETLSEEEVRAITNGVQNVTVNAVWEGGTNDELRRAGSINFFINSDCEIEDGKSSGFTTEHSDKFTPSLYTSRILVRSGATRNRI